MRTAALLTLVACAGVLLAPGGAFAHTVPATCSSPGFAVPGEAEMSANVEHLASFPDEGLDMTAGGRRVGDRFYMTGVSHFSVYDIAEPAKPKLLSRTNFACRFENEDVAVDGKTLIYSDFATDGALYAYDVRDPRNPKQVSELAGAGTHTTTCVLRCRYLFGSYKTLNNGSPAAGGEVVDLADPARPRVLGDWTEGGVLPSRKVHDVTEIAPGLVLTASSPIQLMDVRANPVRPRVLARSTEPRMLWHSVEWPRKGLDRFMLASTETNATPRCEAGVGDFAVYDAGRAAQTGRLEPRSTYQLTNTNTDRSSGNPIVNAGLGCSPHWFEARPDWHDGGVVALGAYDHGAKFLRVNPLGQVAEVGHFRAPGTNASASYWITCDIVYVVDYTRGLDVLRFKDASSNCKRPAVARRPERLNARVRARWRSRRRYTQLRRLTVSRLPVAASVRVRCRGRGCRRRSRKLAVRRGRVATTRFRRWRLRPGTVLEVRVSRPGATTQRVAWRVRAGRAPRLIRRR